MNVPSTRRRHALVIGLILTVLGVAGGSRGEGLKPLWADGGMRPFWQPRSAVDVADALHQSASRTTIPLWKGSFTYQSVTYPYVMVGTDPSLGSQTSRIPVVIVPIEFDLPGGIVLSPSKPVCNGSETAVQLTKKSPIFVSTAFAPGGTNVGHTQYVDAFQRANFWSAVSTTSPRYHVKLKSPTILPTQVVSVPAASAQVFSGPCSDVAILDFGFLVTTLLDIHSRLPQVTPTALAIALTYNVFSTGAAGFHYAIDFGAGVQTFIVAAYTDLDDISVLSHEVGEWMDDPLANNPTPGWLAGQATTCQFNLEVGDPVSGVNFPVTTGTTTYHPEDLVFVPWFARQTPSTSVNGWYTFLNTYRSPPPVCSPSGAFLDDASAF